MTTVAWDGTTLAADTLAVTGNLKRYCQKIFRLNDGRLYGGCGNTEDVLAVLAYLNGADKPTLMEAGSFAGLLIEKDGRCVRLEGAMVPMPIFESYHAIGSGRDFAMAVMALWHGAVKAVEMAVRFDVYTGGEIETLCLQPTELL